MTEALSKAGLLIFAEYRYALTYNPFVVKSAHASACLVLSFV
jgi:hypothetical protein